MLQSIDVDKCEVDVFPITNSGSNYEVINKYANVLGINQEKAQQSKGVTVRVKARLFRLVKQIKKLLCLIGIDISAIVFRRLARSLEKNHYDEVIAFQEGQATLLVSFINIDSKISWVHCDYSTLPLNKKGIERNQAIYKKYSKIICVSDFTRTKFLSIHPELSDRTVAIHNVMAVKRIKELSIESPNCSEFEFYSGIKIVSIGRIAPVKRFSFIPEIAANLKKRGLCFCWYIIGGDDSDLNNVDNNIKKYQVADCVKLLGNKNNPYSFIKSADLLVCTSLSEACPNVLNEAKIIGTPIVSTNFGSVNEIMTNQIEGIVTPIELIDEAIYNFLSNKTILDKVKENLSYYIYDNRILFNKIEDNTSLVFK